MNRMTIGQFLNTVKCSAEVYIQSAHDTIGDQLVEITDYIRGSSCVMAWEVSEIYTLEDRESYVLQVDLSPVVVAALEEE